MNRNVESHFSQIPAVDVERSIFDRSSTHKTSFNVGDLIPFYVDEVLPGDTFRITTSKVVRLQTMLTPIMDNIYLDTYFFFVPNRLIWTHWKEFMGESNYAWLPTTTYQVPRIASPENGFDSGTIADYMGLPVNVEWSATDFCAPMALPFRAYAKICDDWFRSEALTIPLNIPMGDSNQTGTNGGSFVSDVANGGKPFVACKYFDAFTSCLPAPQKGPDVNFNLINGPLAPVGTMSRSNANFPSFTASDFTLNNAVLKWNLTTDPTTEYVPADSSPHALGITASGNTSPYEQSFTTGTNIGNIAPWNLVADLSTTVGNISINELRLAFQLQKFYERCARGGTRYIELLKVHFGVTSPDARLQRSEYLGGNRIPLSVHEVTNSAQSESDFLGDLGAKSATSDIHEDFEHSFTEHGFVIGVCVARYDHTYSNNIDRFWLRKNMTDYYFPVFANIGEVPVYECEVDVGDSTDHDEAFGETVFGYQEAWYDYRYKPSRVSGEMRPQVSNTLASWHLADNYSALPALSDKWIREDKTNVDRVLAVTSEVSNQIFADIYVQNICTRCMPTYSIPGLIDHH